MGEARAKLGGVDKPQFGLILPLPFFVCFPYLYFDLLGFDQVLSHLCSLPCFNVFSFLFTGVSQVI